MRFFKPYDNQLDTQHLAIQVVQQFAGHSDITTTKQYYLSVQPENMKSASKIMNQMLEEVNS